MTQINSITARHYAAPWSRENTRAYQGLNRGIWRGALPYIVLLAALGVASAVAAIANPLAFADIFRAL